MIEYLAAVSFFYGLIFAIFFALITVITEIVIEKRVMDMWQMSSSSKSGMLILKREIFLLKGFIG